MELHEARQIYVGKNYEKYQKYFEIFDKNPNKFKATWSWHGFLFAPAWLIYRKMYLNFVIFFIANSLISFLFNNLSIKLFQNFMSPIYAVNLSTFIIPILLSIIVGIIGNWSYYKHVDEKILKIRDRYNINESKIKDTLISEGKKSIAASLIFVYILLPMGLYYPTMYIYKLMNDIPKDITNEQYVETVINNGLIPKSECTINMMTIGGTIDEITYEDLVDRFGEMSSKEAIQGIKEVNNIIINSSDAELSSIMTEYFKQMDDTDIVNSSKEIIETCGIRDLFAVDSNLLPRYAEMLKERGL